MKKFLLKSLLVVFILSVVTMPNILYSIIAPRWLALFEIADSKTVVFVGDSHVANGINDEFIPGGFNFAKPAEIYLNIYPRLKKLLDKNPKISTVFIGVSPYCLEKNGDSCLHNNGSTKILLFKNLGIYSAEELRSIEPNIYFGYLLSKYGIKSGFKSFYSLISKSSQEIFGDMGGYNMEQVRDLKKDLEPGVAHKRLFSVGKMTFYGNELQRKYLRKIVEMARAHGVRVIFLNTPIYHAEKFFDVPYFENLLKTEFPDVEFWDYVNFSVPEDCRKDVNHLNKWGAEIFSKELARRMREEEIIPCEN
ncbi:MAG: hypothetical protein LUD39_07140 [Opitutae bacterium]|nr:hypothetical protein [Opitutae bacterium]